jgi:hypothetical protein
MRLPSREENNNRKIDSSKLLKKCRTFKANDPLVPKIIRTKKAGKGNGILKLPKLKDIVGNEYIAFCNFKYHTGIILDNPESCIIKKCHYYRTAYLEKPDFRKIILPEPHY